MFKAKCELMLTSLCIFYFQLNYQGRVIQYKAKGRVHRLKWSYVCTVWDVESGHSRTSNHCKSKQGAIEHAVKELIDVLKDEGLVS